MSRRFMTSFAFSSSTYDKYGGITPTTSGTGTATIDNTVEMHAPASCRLQSGSNGYANYTAASLCNSVGCYTSAHILFNAFPASGEVAILTIDIVSGDDIYLKVSSTGGVNFYVGSSLIGSRGSSITTGVIYAFDIKATATGVAARVWDIASESPSEFATGANNRPLLGVIVGPTANCADLDMRFTNLAVNDTGGAGETSYPGLRRVVLAQPAGAGSSNSWHDTDDNAGSTNNYTLVNESPPSTSNYLRRVASSAAMEDYYTLPSAASLGIDAGATVGLIAVCAYHRTTSSSYATPQYEVKGSSAGTALRGSALNIIPYTNFGTNVNGAYVMYPQVVAYTNPSTAAAWTVADLATTEIGVYKSTGSSGAEYHVSTMWAFIEYVPGAGRTTTIDGTATITGAATIDYAVAAEAAGSGVLAASARLNPVSLAGVGSVQGSPVLAQHATATCAGTAELAGAGTRTRADAATCAGAGGLTASAVADHHATVTLAGEATAIGALRNPVDLAGVATLTGAPSRATFTAGVLDGVANLTAEELRTAVGDVELPSVGAVAGEGRITPGVILGGVGTVEVASTRTLGPATVGLPGSGELTAEGGRSTSVTATVAGTASCSGSADLPATRTVTLAGVGSVGAVAHHRATVTLAGVGVLDPYPGQRARVTLAGVGALSCPAGRDTTIAASVAGVARVTVSALPLTRHSWCELAGRAVVAGDAEPPLFPAEPLDVTVRIRLSSTWVDISRYVWCPEGGDGLTRAMWRGDGATTSDPAEVKLTLLSPNGLFNPRNKGGAYWWYLSNLFGSSTNGIPIEVKVEGIPFIAGGMTDIATKYDMDGAEYAEVTVRGPLYRAYRDNYGVDPINSSVLASEPLPVMYWPMTEGAGAREFASGFVGESATVPWTWGARAPLSVCGAAHGLGASGETSNLGAVEGPPGSPHKFPNCAVNLNKSSQNLIETYPTGELGNDSARANSLPLAGWVGSVSNMPWEYRGGYIPWDPSGLAIDFAVKMSDGRTEADGLYYSDTDPSIYSYSDSWTGDNTYLHWFFGADNQPNTLLHLQLANGRAVTISLDQYVVYDATGAQLKDRWGDGKCWGIAVRYGSHVNPGRVFVPDGQDSLWAYCTRQIQNILFDGGWHHVRVAFRADTPRAVEIYVDGRLQRGTFYEDTGIGDAGTKNRLDQPAFDLIPTLPRSVYVKQLDAARLKVEAIGIGYLAIRSGTDHPTEPMFAVSGFVGETATERLGRILASRDIPSAISQPSRAVLSAQETWSTGESVAAIENADMGRVIELPSGSVTYERVDDRYNVTGFTLDLDVDQLGAPPEFSGPSKDFLRAFVGTRIGTAVGSEEAFTLPGYPGGQVGSGSAGLANPARLAAWAGARAKQLRPDLDAEIKFSLNMAATPELIKTWLYAVAHPPISVRITGIPGVTEPPELFVDGFSERISPLDWFVDVTCSPAANYRAGSIDAGVRQLRYDSQVIAARKYTSASTTIAVVPRSLPNVTVDGDDYPLDINIYGERVTAVSAVRIPAEVRRVGAITTAISPTPVIPDYPPCVTNDLLLMMVVDSGAVGDSISITPAWTRIGSGRYGGIGIGLYAHVVEGLSVPTIRASRPGITVHAQILATKGVGAVALAGGSNGGNLGNNPCIAYIDSGPLVSGLGILLTARRNACGVITPPLGTTLIGQVSDSAVSAAWAWIGDRILIPPHARHFHGETGSGTGFALSYLVAANITELTVVRHVNGVYRSSSVPGSAIDLYDPPLIAL